MGFVKTACSGCGRASAERGGLTDRPGAPWPVRSPPLPSTSKPFAPTAPSGSPPVFSLASGNEGAPGAAGSRLGTWTVGTIGTPRLTGRLEVVAAGGIGMPGDGLCATRLALAATGNADSSTAGVMKSSAISGVESRRGASGRLDALLFLAGRGS